MAGLARGFVNVLRPVHWGGQLGRVSLVHIEPSLPLQHPTAIPISECKP